MWRRQHNRYALDQEWGIAERQLDVLRFTPPFSGNTFLVVLVLVFLSMGVVPASFVLWFCLGIFFVSTCLRLGHMEQLSLDHQQPVAAAPAGPFALSFLRSSPFNDGAPMLLLSPGHGLLLMDNDWVATGNRLLFNTPSNNLTDVDFAQLSTHVHTNNCQHCNLSRANSASPLGLPCSSTTINSSRLLSGDNRLGDGLQIGWPGSPSPVGGSSNAAGGQQSHCRASMNALSAMQQRQQTTVSAAEAYQGLAAAYSSTDSSGLFADPAPRHQTAVGTPVPAGTVQPSTWGHAAAAGLQEISPFRSSSSIVDSRNAFGANAPTWAPAAAAAASGAATSTSFSRPSDPSAATAASEGLGSNSTVDSLQCSNLLKALNSAVSLDSLDDNSRPVCSVCLGRYKDGQLVTTLSCGHAYHRDCIYPWLLQQGRQATCPMCKAQVFA